MGRKECLLSVIHYGLALRRVTYDGRSARSVVKNNKLLQYPSGGVSGHERAKGGQKERREKRASETEKPRENRREQLAPRAAAVSFSSLFRARWMPVRERVINNDLMSSNNGHHGWFRGLAPSGGLREITRRRVLASCLFAPGVICLSRSFFFPFFLLRFSYSLSSSLVRSSRRGLYTPMSPLLIGKAGHTFAHTWGSFAPFPPLCPLFLSRASETCARCPTGLPEPLTGPREISPLVIYTRSRWTQRR